MATDSKPTEPVEGSWSPRRTQGSTKAQGPDSKPSTDPDMLASQIERTREDLAETLDAIADKVSPKRVAHRTTESAKESVAEKTALVKEKAAEATETVKEKAVEATETVKEKAVEATETVKEAATSLKEKVASRSDSAGVDRAGVDRAGVADGPVRLGTATSTGSLADAYDAGQVGLEPAGSEVPPYTSSLQYASASSRTPVLAGAAAAVLVVLFLLRRRRS